MPQQLSMYPECRHILSSGQKCHAPALRGRPFCFHHGRHRNLIGRNQRSIDSVELPAFEDQNSILLALNQVVFALTRGRITDKMAARLLYAIQLAQNAINRAETLPAADLVTDYLDGRYGDIVAPAEPQTETGSETSPETSPEPSTEDDNLQLLSEYVKTHSGHGDTCWEPTNGDYPDHPAAPQPTPMEPGPQKLGPQKSGPQKSGPWDNPLLDHIVHQLESGMSEHEIAAQLTRDLRSNNSFLQAPESGPPNLALSS